LAKFEWLEEAAGKSAIFFVLLALVLFILNYLKIIVVEDLIFTVCLTTIGVFFANCFYFYFKRR